jgi:predicted RNase H-like HicB family nuclease
MSTTSAEPHYSMHIAWSEKDQAYLVTVPEWMPHLLNTIAVTHGDTYEAAARNGREVLETLIEVCREEGRPLPAPQMVEYDDANDAPREMPRARRLCRGGQSLPGDARAGWTPAVQ